MCRRAFRCAGAYLVSLLRPIQLPSLSKSMPTESPACCLQECQGWVRALYDCRHVPCMPVLYAQWYMLVVGATMCLWRPVPRRRGKRVLSFIRNTVWMKPMREVYGNTRRRRARMFLEPAARFDVGCYCTCTTATTTHGFNRFATLVCDAGDADCIFPRAEAPPDAER